MRFSVAVAVLAGVVAANRKNEEPAASTAYATEYFTITSCAPEVTNCPARSTVVSSSVHAIPTAPVVPSNPYQSYSVPAGGAPSPSFTPVYTSSAWPGYETPGAAACASVSIETISTSYTTVVPTVSYITHSAACPTTTPVVPANPIVPAHPSNGTIPHTTASTTPIPTGGASAMGASALLAAVAGAIALFA